MSIGIQKPNFRKFSTYRFNWASIILQATLWVDIAKSKLLAKFRTAFDRADDIKDQVDNFNPPKRRT